MTSLRRSTLGGLAVLALTLSPGTGASAPGSTRSARDPLCFAAGSDLHFVVRRGHGGQDTLPLAGKVAVPGVAPPASLALRGAARVRTDGRLEMVATMGVGAFPGSVTFLLAARLDPPAFESGHGFLQRLEVPPLAPQPMVLTPETCFEAFPDAP